MHAIKQVRDYIEKHPASENGRALAQFAEALSEEREFSLAGLYQLNYETFELAIDLLKDWRLDRYYAGETRLFDDIVIKGAAVAEPLPA